MPKRDERIFIGLHSGPTGDGVDAALVAIAGHGTGIKVRQVAHIHHPCEPSLAVVLRNLLFSGAPPGKHVSLDVSTLDEHVAKTFAAAAGELLHAANLAPKRVTAIGSGGHRVGDIELGGAGAIAEAVGRPVIAGFAAHYLAAGGKGAATDWCDWRLFSDVRLSRVVVSLGALATVTFLPADAQVSDVITFDAGPGMCVVDGLCRRLMGAAFDSEGQFARRGKPDLALVNELLANRYFQTPPPKRAVPADWGDIYVERLILSARHNAHGATGEDMLATATEFTAQAIARAAGAMTERPHQVILCGGGALNVTLLGRIRAMMCPSSTITCEKFGIGVRAKHAVCCAMLAAERDRGPDTGYREE